MGRARKATLTGLRSEICLIFDLLGPWFLTSDCHACWFLPVFTHNCLPSVFIFLFATLLNLFSFSLTPVHPPFSKLDVHYSFATSCL